MQKYGIEEFENLIREKRAEIPSPYARVYKEFIALGYDKKDKDYFINNASEIVENLRSACWDTIVPLRNDFTTKMLCELIDEDAIDGLPPHIAIENYLKDYSEHIYRLCLSNTQSLRSCAGKEFEILLELILMGAELPLDSQGNIGKSTFTRRGLGKLVDLVLPGVTEYEIDKNYTVLISAKTTLRERWQEVPEEMGRTGAREMFLATLDDTISADVLETLKEANIRIVTTSKIKNNKYKSNRQVISFEQLIEICNEIVNRWQTNSYSSEEKEGILLEINKLKEKHNDKDFIISYCQKMQARII